MKQNVFIYMAGSRKNADVITEYFLSLGAENPYDVRCDNPAVFYYIGADGALHTATAFKWLMEHYQRLYLHDIHLINNNNNKNETD